MIWGANQWTGFYMVTASVMKELMGMHEIWIIGTKFFNIKPFQLKRNAGLKYVFRSVAPIMYQSLIDPLTGHSDPKLCFQPLKKLFGHFFYPA